MKMLMEARLARRANFGCKAAQLLHILPIHTPMLSTWAGTPQAHSRTLLAAEAKRSGAIHRERRIQHYSRTGLV